MRMFAGVTSMAFVIATMSAGCATADMATNGVHSQTAATVPAGPADAVMYVNGLSCPL